MMNWGRGEHNALPFAGGVLFNHTVAHRVRVINETLVAAGSSPSTIALHDVASVSTRSVVTLSYDLRNAIHGLEVWPFE